MKILTSQIPEVSVFNDGVTTKEVITTFMENNEWEVS
jgi:hypothetical protein